MKTSILSLIILQILSLTSPAWAANTGTSIVDKKKFIVTAYYSPLPDQSFYLKGSYEADLRLNGNGTHGASGKEVYPGMLAAPKTYSFGTKIYLEGLGVGTVEDRGGAIVSSGSRGYDADRIDIWMGQWEEGLKRALTWGKRSVQGKIMSEEDADERSAINLARFQIAKINTSTYKKESSTGNTDNPATEPVFTSAISKDSEAERIRELQIILSRLSYYNGPIDGKYTPSLEGAIYDFQTETGLVGSKKDFGAGYYGVKTRSKLQEVYVRYTENEKKRVAEEARIAAIQAEEIKQKEVRKNEVVLFVQNLGTPKSDEVGQHIRSLQQTLKSLGYFNGKDTAIFGKNTRAALISYQRERKIDASESGTLGKATKEALFHDLLTLREKQGAEVAFAGK